MARRSGWLLRLGSSVVLLFVAVAILAPFLAPVEPQLSFGPPLQPPSSQHLLGTNDLGQDVLSQLIYGTRTTLIVVVTVTLISTLLSWLVGITAGFLRRAETPLMAITDLLLALPNVPLYLLALTLLGPSLRNLVLVLALLSWPGFARVVRSTVIQTRSAPYVVASLALGASTPHIMYQHLLPATLAILPTKLVLTVRFAVFAEATLAFLGLGSSGTVTWGQMLNTAFNDPLLFSRPVWPWLVVPPMLAIIALILATSWISAGIAHLDRGFRRPAWQPRPAHNRTGTARYLPSQQPHPPDSRLGDVATGR